MRKSYSGKQITKAGEALADLDNLLKDKEEFEKIMDIVSYWRFCHETPLDEAFLLLKEVTLKKDKKSIFARRLKRYVSIYLKLVRFEKMNLKNMQDIGGCRAIVSNEKKLRQSVRELRKLANFRDEKGKYRYKDYIKNPKDDGYRSYHLVGKFVGRTGEKRNIELQLRTNIQHYWATALEIVDLFTDQALKSNQGDEIWKQFFFNVSEQFAVMDRIHMFDTLTDQEKFNKYLQEIKKSEDLIESCGLAKIASKKLKVRDKLIAFSESLKIVDEKIDTAPESGYALVKIDTMEHAVYTTLFKDDDSKSAENRYIEEEKEAAQRDGIVIALISTNAVGGIKEAYPNYFADSTEFAKHLSFIVASKV